MLRQKVFNLAVIFLLLQPWLVSSKKSETAAKVLELQGSNSLITPVYTFNSRHFKLKYKFSGSKLSSSFALRIIPVKPANTKEILIYRTGDGSQTIPLKFKKFYFIVSAMEGNWQLVAQAAKNKN